MEKNMDVVELLETPVESIQLSTKKLSTRMCNALKRRKIYNIRDIIFWENDELKRIQNLGTKCYDDLKQSITKFGINIEDNDQCKYLIHQYTEKKQKNMTNITNIMETKLEENEEDIPLYIFESNGYKTILDIVSDEKDKIKKLLYNELGIYSEWNYFRLAFMLIKYNIDINNEEQCKKIIEQYKKEKQNQQKQNKKEINRIIRLEQIKNKNNVTKAQQLKNATKENDMAERKVKLKQKVLEDIKKQVQRSILLKQQQAACDEEYHRLVEQYNSIDLKESSNNHGTK